MATKLFLRDSKDNAIGVFRDLLVTAGAGVAPLGEISTAASGTEIQWKNNGQTELLEWISGRVPAGGFTLSGTMTFSIWARESNMNANCGARARVFKRTAAGSESEIGGGPYNDGVEFGTGPGEFVWTGTPTSTAFAENDRIIVRYYITNIGTMASGHTCSIDYGAPDASQGDSFFQINENVTFKVDNTIFDKTVDRTCTPTRSIVRSAEKPWSRTASGEATFVKGRITNKTASATSTASLLGSRQIGKLIDRTAATTRTMVRDVGKLISRTSTVGLTRRSVITKRIRARSAPKGLYYVGGKMLAVTAGASPPAAISLTGLTGGIGTSPIIDDVVVVIYHVGAGSDVNAQVTTAGYTSLLDLYYDGEFVSDANLAIAAKIMGPTADTDVSVSATGNTNNAGIVSIQVWRGVTAAILDTAVVTAAGFVGSPTPNPPSITPVTDGAHIIVVGAASRSGGYSAAFTQVAGELANFTSLPGDMISNGNVLGVGTYAWSSGAFDPVQWQHSSGDTNSTVVSAALVLRPAAPGVGSGGASGNASSGSSATLTKSASKAFFRTVDLTHSLVRSVGKLIARTASTTQSIVADFMSGSTTTPKTVNAASTPGTALTRQTGKPTSLTAAVTASIQRNLARVVSRTASGVVNVSKSTGKIVNRTVTNARTFVRTTAHVVDRTISTARTLARSTSKAFSRAVSTVATTTQIKVILQTLNRTVDVATTVSKVTGKLVSRTATMALTIGKSVVRTVQRATTPAITLVKSTGKLIFHIVAVTRTISAVKVQLQTISRTVTPIATAAILRLKVFGISVTVTRAIVRSTGKLLSRAITVVRSFVHLPDFVVDLSPLSRRASVTAMDRRHPVDRLLRRASVPSAITRRASVPPDGDV